MPLLLHARDPKPSEPQQGVIDDARRRQRLRRNRAATAAATAGLIAGVAWALGGAGTHPRSARVEELSSGSTDRSRTGGPAFRVRLVPMLNLVGMAGWCEIPEEHGVPRGGACGGDLPTPSQPFVQIFGSGEASSPVETQFAVTNPAVAAVLIDGRRRVQTTTLPGLPYGLRGARIVARAGATLAALDGSGHLLPQRWGQPPPRATVRRWRYPQHSPRAACQLQNSWLPGLAVRGGAVATSIRPFPGQLIGHAFLPCATTEYEMLGMPLKAFLVLDAAQPATRAADLPSFHPVSAAPGIFAAGELTAMRSGNAWLVAEQGRGFGERTVLLRHLHATVRLGR
jgi:hypothetical protein